MKTFRDSPRTLISLLIVALVPLALAASPSDGKPSQAGVIYRYLLGVVGHGVSPQDDARAKTGSSLGLSPVRVTTNGDFQVLDPSDSTFSKTLGTVSKDMVSETPPPELPQPGQGAIEASVKGGSRNRPATGSHEACRNFNLSDVPSLIPPLAQDRTPPPSQQTQPGSISEPEIIGRVPASDKKPPAPNIPTSIPPRSSAALPDSSPARGGGISPSDSSAIETTIPPINPPISGSTMGQDTNNVISVLGSAVDTANNARGLEIVESAIRARNEVNGAILHDQTTLVKAYNDVPNEAIPSYLHRAKEALNDALSAFDNTKSSELDRSEQIRFRNAFLNARDKVDFGLNEIQAEQERQRLADANSPFSGLLSGGAAMTGFESPNPLARSQGLAEIFGAKLPVQNVATADNLVNRLILFNGLPPQQQALTLRNIQFAEKFKFDQKSVVILHNGYIFGGKGKATDCSKLASSVLPADVRKGRLTTLDMVTIWKYRHTGVFPFLPKYNPTSRIEFIKQMSSAYLAIDLRAKEPLWPGDFLIYALDNDPARHVFIVRSFNPKTLQSEVIEASQSAGTVRERSFNLSLDPIDAPRRFLRVGLYALRLRDTDNRACSFKDHRPPTPSRGVAH